MSYTFTTTTSYALNTHVILFTATHIYIKLSSTGQTVYSKDFSQSDLAFMCQGNDFCVGTLNDNGTFSKTVDFSNKDAGLFMEEQDDDNQFIGTDDTDDTAIYNRYAINDCPVRLSSHRNVVTIECPCEGGAPCANSCYTYGS